VFSHARPTPITPTSWVGVSAKNKHLLAIYAIPTRGFTAALSVFEGTPPPKPLRLKCKTRAARSGDDIDSAWAHHLGDDSTPVSTKINLSPEDITWMSRFSCSQIVRSSLTARDTVSSAGKTKTPPTFP
jgi:hypothetical protein